MFRRRYEIQVPLEVSRLFAAREACGHPEMADGLDADGDLEPSFVR